MYDLKRSFDEMNYETMIFDTRDMVGSLMKFFPFVMRPVDAAVTFNNLGLNMEIESGINVWEQYLRYLERFYPNIPVIGYLPHGGKRISDHIKPISERTIDVIYAGGLSRDLANRVYPDFSKYKDFDVKEVCRHAYDDLINKPEKTTEQAIEESRAATGVKLDDDELRHVIADLHFIDLYAVSYYREKTVRAVAESGIELTLCGFGWENCEWINRPNVHYIGRISADDVVEKMQDAKVVLSTMTWFKDGTHDRVFNGMLAGAVTASDTSLYMKEEFKGFKETDGRDEREMIMFELEDIESLPGMINEVLNDNKLAQNIADRGRKKAEEAHTWKARAMELERDLFSQL